MSSANGPTAKGGASAKPGNKDGFIAKAAGAVIASGIAWSIYKSFAPSKGVQFVKESLGFRSSSGENPGSTVDDFGSNAKEQTNEVTPSPMHRETELKDESEDTGSTVGGEANSSSKEGKKKANKGTGKFQGIQNHEIIGGETLYTISRKYEVSVEALKDVNGLFGDHIAAGEKLIIPSKGLNFF